MSIVLVGGHERMQDEYKVIANRHGYRIKVFTQMPPRFDKSIGRPDAIVLFTSTVSHKMVLTAVKEAKRKRIPIMRSHSSSSSSLEQTLKQLKSIGFLDVWNLL
ncbi:MAG: DUF2325 domain-containing protein [Clostridia bacterium]|nr:DUF2325 domain-containing protein [Clostridia bacterium]